MMAGQADRDVTDKFHNRYVANESGCWTWTGGTFTTGKPRFILNGKCFLSAHVWSYERFIGPVPHAMVVDQTCNNPMCVRPEHLRLISMKECVRLRRKPRHIPPHERFASRYTVNEDGCWIWLGAARGAYGSFCYAAGRSMSAHRWSYQHFVGQIPEGYQIHHLCRVPACVNPAHLTPLSPREHARLENPMIRRNVESDTCVHGHPWTPENTYNFITPRGGAGRCCRRCRADREQKRRSFSRSECR